MAKDDMQVIMFKILSYFYETLKKGEEPKPEYYRFDSPYIAIPEPYWTNIMHQLESNGYIEGVQIVSDMSGNAIVVESSPSITIKGVEFLSDNSGMQKALKWLKEVKAVLPWL